MKNWKTTVLGFAAGSLHLLQTGVNWKSALVAAAMAALGLSAKDHDVTGGTKEQ